MIFQFRKLTDSSPYESNKKIFSLEKSKLFIHYWKRKLWHYYCSLIYYVVIFNAFPKYLISALLFTLTVLLRCSLSLLFLLSRIQSEITHCIWLWQLQIPFLSRAGSRSDSFLPFISVYRLFENSRYNHWFIILYSLLSQFPTKYKEVGWTWLIVDSDKHLLKQVMVNIVSSADQCIRGHKLWGHPTVETAEPEFLLRWLMMDGLPPLKKSILCL